MKRCVVVLGVALCVGCQLPARDARDARDVGQLVQQADRLFNAQRHEEALDLYMRAYRLVPPSSPIQGEIANNIAAVYMTKGDLENFRTYFQFGNRVKAGIAEAEVVRGPPSTDTNLLYNGGFETGLVSPWGSGHYERAAGKTAFGTWWNSSNVRAYMKIDTDQKHSGRHSLRITNFSPTAAHVFSTTAQRIAGLQPNTVYRISLYVKTQDLSPGAVLFTVDAAWVKRVLPLAPGTSDWRQYSATINIGHNDYIDFRILHLSTGTAWLDDIVVEKASVLGPGDRVQQAESLFNRSEFDEALKIFQQLEREFPDNTSMLIATRLYSGRIYEALGRYDEARAAFLWVVDHGHPRAYIDLGDLHFHIGDFAQADRYLGKALEVVSGDQGTHSLVLNKLGRSHLAQGRLDQAFTTQQRALFVLSHIGDQHGQALVRNSLGEIQVRRKAYREAVVQFEAASRLAEQLDAKPLVLDALNNLAEAVLRDGRPAAARTYLDRALRLASEIGDRRGQVQSLYLLGLLGIAQGQLYEALDHFRRAVRLAEQLYAHLGTLSKESKSAFIRQFSNLYRAYIDLLLRLNDADSALGDEAFQAVEHVRSRVFTEMITEGRAALAFASSSRDEDFARLLAEERAALLRIALAGKRRREFFEQRGTKDPAVRREIEQQEARAEARYAEIREELRRKYPRYADLKAPRRLSVTDARGLLRQDEAVLSFFVTEGHTAVWAITRDQVRLKVLDLGRGQIADATRDLRGAFGRIADALSGVSGQMGDVELRRAFAQYDVGGAHDLYRLLVAPVVDLLRGKRLVYLVPDDVLYQLPFEALVTEPFAAPRDAPGLLGAGLEDAPFWTRVHHLTYVPSVSVLRSVRTMGKGSGKGQKSLLAFADPVFEDRPSDVPGDDDAVGRRGLIRRLRSSGVLRDSRLAPLPDTRQEAMHAARVLEASTEDVYLGLRASETNVKRLPLAEYRYVLFATHGLLAGEFKPGVQPALALSFVGDADNDGLLEMGEILALEMNAELVVLSACNTASGASDQDRGEGFAGLTRSFMYAGAESLLVTLWSVESSTARTLMEDTFAGIKANGKATALAQAKRAMFSRPRQLKLSSALAVSTSHPFFWAPFVLVGEGR